MSVQLSRKQTALITGALKLARTQALNLNARSSEAQQAHALFDEALQALSSADTDSQPKSPKTKPATTPQPPHLREYAKHFKAIQNNVENLEAA